jgi:hypothetical protein
MDLLNNEGVGGDTTAVSPDTLNNEFSRVLDVNPHLLDATDNDPKKPSPKPPANPNAGKATTLWEKMKFLLNPVNGLRGAQEAENAVTRGVIRGADQLSNTLVRGGVELSKKTGAYKVGRSPEEQKAFLDWWDQSTSKANPLQFGEDRIKRWYGPSAGGLTGFVEGASQFATGMAAMGALKLPGLGGTVGTVVKGAGADMTAFDPHAKRLSNMVEEDAPSWMRNRVTAYLKSDENDSEALSRVKAGMEPRLARRLGGATSRVEHDGRPLLRRHLGMGLLQLVEILLLRGLAVPTFEGHRS